MTLRSLVRSSVFGRWCIFIAKPDGLTEPILWTLTFFLNLGLAVAISAIAQFLYVVNPRSSPARGDAAKVSPHVAPTSASGSASGTASSSSASTGASAEGAAA